MLIPLSKQRQKNRPMERVLRHKQIKEFLKANGLTVHPPYSETQWNYWHVYEKGMIQPITAEELLQGYREWRREHYISAEEEAAAQHLYPLRPELRHEIERLKSILKAHGRDFAPQKGVPRARLRRTERKLGYQLDPDLRAFYAFSDGGPVHNGWFAVGIQNPVAVDFLCLDASLESWQRFAERQTDEDREYWERVERLGNLTRDSRIAPGLWFPPQWWQFAANDYDNMVMVDSRPGPRGKQGQIIAYYHDPDALVCVADNFLDFFKKSNDFLETRWEKIFSGESEEE